MKVLITGTSSGIGLAVAQRFLKEGFEVFGLDLNESSINDKNYHHYNVDIVKVNQLPDIRDINIIFNNAGLQNSNDDIENNLKGTINVTEKYGFQDSVKAILFNASASARTGQEFPYYVASKAGVVGYMKHVAITLADQRGITVNSISFGGVVDDLNKPVMEDKKCWEDIMKVTPFKKWTSLEEASEWVIFITLMNKSMSGQDLLVDNGENDLNPRFVWPK